MATAVLRTEGDIRPAIVDKHLEADVSSAPDRNDRNHSPWPRRGEDGSSYYSLAPMLLLTVRSPLHVSGCPATTRTFSPVTVKLSNHQ